MTLKLAVNELQLVVSCFLAIHLFGVILIKATIDEVPFLFFVSSAQLESTNIVVSDEQYFNQLCSSRDYLSWLNYCSSKS